MFPRAFLAVFILAVLRSLSAFAADAVSGDACTVTNAYMQSGGPDTSGNQYFMRCNGSTWSAPIMFTSAGYVGIGNTTPAGRLVVAPPTAETIAGGATITADGCGTVKQLDLTGNRTTNTTNTFTAPAAANAGCCMDVVNINGTYTVSLDANANFRTSGGTNALLTPYDGVRVCSNGATWYQVGAASDNQ